MTYETHDTTDALGLPKRVLIPAGADPSEGIPVSFDFEQVYARMPAPFIAELTKACWARGLIEPCDFLKPGADQLFKSAMLSVIKHDFLSVQTIAQEICHGGK